MSSHAMGSTGNSDSTSSSLRMYEEESQSSRLSRKTQEAPFFPIAIGVCTAAVIYGAYQFKNKGKMSTSVYLMQLRVGAQGLAVGTLMVGLCYSMGRKLFSGDYSSTSSTDSSNGTNSPSH